ncbi:lipid-transfer protein [Striga asiatica]|uniref:Lipid-transfer protein n=1 Tax=Striga asiatica TaxID=4170 RepID=A0A5A7P648_STRAF|nr:lipid-transfer protein [Striga asiatica]
MATTKNSSSIAIFLALNVVFFTLSSACGTCPTPKPTPPPPKPKSDCPSPPAGPSHGKATCPRDTLKLGVCADLLGGLIDITIGTPPKTPCCTLIQGLADLEAAVCLCTAIKANVLGINLNVPLSLSLLLNVCSKEVPKGFQCA